MSMIMFQLFKCSGLAMLFKLSALHCHTHIATLVTTAVSPGHTSTKRAHHTECLGVPAELLNTWVLIPTTPLSLATEKIFPVSLGRVAHSKTLSLLLYRLNRYLTSSMSDLATGEINHHFIV